MVFMEKDKMKFFMLASHQLKQRKNQYLHMLDERGKTYCQLENIKRKKRAVELIEVTDVTGRSHCKSCRAVKDKKYRPMKESVDSLTAAFMATIG